MNLVSYKFIDKKKHPINFKTVCEVARLDPKFIKKIGINLKDDGEIIYTTKSLDSGEEIWHKVNINDTASTDN